MTLISQRHFKLPPGHAIRWALLLTPGDLHDLTRTYPVSSVLS